MNLTFLGGAGTVTGSKYLVESGARRLLVDCGLFQGLKNLRLRNRAPLPVEPATIGSVVLTHAHLDHSGYLPALIRDGYAGRIHCSPATRDLCEILLPDSGFLQEKDAEFANRHGFSKHRPALPLYTLGDAERALGHLEPLAFGSERALGGGASARLHRAGHILGASIVEHFAAQGAKVGFIDIDEAASTALVEKLGGAGYPPPLFAKCDVRDITAYQAAIGAVAAKFGPVTALINNAARDDRHDIADVTPAFWDERIAVNLRHQYFAIQAVAPGMKKAGGGSIVNFSSVSYHSMTPQLSVYQAAKAAVIGMTRGLARDLGPDRIRLNAITPGWIMTQRQIDLWLTPEAEAALMVAQCLKEKVYPPDIARMALWLAADDSRLVTAQNFVVDGGRM